MGGLSVCHVLSTFGLGGMERVALDLAAGMQERGHTAMAVGFEPDGPIAHELRAAGVSVESVVRRHRGYDVGLIMRLRQLLRARHIDIVHTHNPTALLYGAPAGHFAGCAVVHTKHGINPSTGQLLNVRRQVGRFVDVYVAVSTATAIVALEKREVDATRLRVIPNGIDLRRFSTDGDARGAVRSELGIGERAFVAGTVGRLAPEKDQTSLLRAAAPLLGDDFHVVLAGTGSEADALRRQADELPNGRSIHFLGARSDVPRVLAAMDVFVLPSITEGLPLAILEAMAAGLPALATPVGGIGEVLREGVTGHFFPVGDAERLRELLGRLRADPAAARRMGNEGRSFALKTYARDLAVDRYLATYEAALEARHGGAWPVRPRDGVSRGTTS
jgi:glycosyltransferase involved in cell wall biosynthesis